MTDVADPTVAPAAPPAAAGADDPITVTCPECGTVCYLRAGTRLASDFCPSCDYPVFWARPSGPAPVAGSGDDSLRRAPGASGAAAVATIACPVCAELNLPTALTCVRCGSSMTPPPPPPTPPLPEPAPVVVVQQAPPIPCGHPNTWLLVLTTAIASVGLTLLVVWLAQR
jgi:hypothetical protein